MPKRIIIFCDESVSAGKYFSNFYGGALVEERLLDEINEVLHRKKIELNLYNEVKFTRITETYQQKYIALLRTFFSLVADGSIKIRLMFTQNLHSTAPLFSKEADNNYFLLYYQLIKHAFGLVYAEGNEPLSLRLNFDRFPQSKERISSFKGCLCALQQSSEFKRRQITITEQDISEVDSRKHQILQCLDIVLGAIQFRLNEGHKVKLPGRRQRAKRTRAKDAVYKAIYNEIKALYPGYQFNPGLSTKVHSGPEYRWLDPYSHWLFMP